MSFLRYPAFVVMILGALAGMVFSASYLVVNVSIIPERLTETIAASQKASNEDAKPAGASEKSSKAAFSQLGWRQKLETISLDLSAVTPFVMLWYFLSILCYSLKYRARVGTESSNCVPGLTLPFHASFGNTCIQLGFIGTLWGFLIIGWRMKDATSKSLSTDVLDILLKAFGTALISTFTAVVVVYILVPPIQRLWRWIMGFCEYEETDLSGVVKNLSEELRNSASALATFQKEVRFLNSELHRLQPKALNAALQEVKAALQEAGKAIGNLPLTLHGQLREIVKEPICERLDGTVKGIELQTELVKELKSEVQNQSRSMKEMANEMKKTVALAGSTNELFGQAIKSADEGIRNVVNRLDRAIDLLSTASTSLAESRSISQELRGQTAGIRKELSEFSKKTELDLKSIQDSKHPSLDAVLTLIKSRSRDLLEKIEELSHWVRSSSSSRIDSALVRQETGENYSGPVKNGFRITRWIRRAFSRGSTD